MLGAIVRAHGGIDELFVSLWNSNKPDRQMDKEDSEEDCCDPANRKESPYEILNFDINEKGPAYTWLDQGADELLDSD